MSRHVPLYMDTHERVRAITLEGETRADERSLEVQAQHGARYLKMWANGENPNDIWGTTRSHNLPETVPPGNRPGPTDPGLWIAPPV